MASTFTKEEHEHMIRRAKDIATRRILRMYPNPDSRDARQAWDRFVTAEYRAMAQNIKRRPTP